MILGYSTNAFVKFSVFEAVEKIGRLGFGGVEIMCDRPHLYPPDYGEENLTRLKTLIDDQGLKVTNLNSFTLFAVGDTYLPSWIEPQEERREIRIQHTLQCLKVADFFGCKNISVPPGGPVGEISREKAMTLFHLGLERVAPLAQELDIKILVEPEPDLLMENTREFKEFIVDIKSPAIGVNFDIGHFFCAGEDPSEAFEELFEWIGHVHLEDIASNRAHNHLILGRGAIQFQEVFKTMINLGYEGDISLELYPYVDTPEEAGRESLEYLRALLQDVGLDLGF
ncbi:MAG: sugar phosphate isomerase/epimerase [Deltaproteobacteria bacterium]|jgi:sugar phosphate isomerase/epimerase|nr:sugar phosphate isomerase/epimerase [Deltaproteobacteria bacterium]MDH3773411.1 sugar phosphate isomerase/epimerase [Deltaproteobacteria bacterium]MDH3801897.1 sugar phosphate isomerase/epimerase [Deltaproteobacteria bacterium]MDH3851293.1 sugar phosphate isomerase/epimerase [Deltaproteobacteria bacterium]MDH3896971.1 sugar phosphate isomerase/epimerase [Deltaproteobacteria bacterium]